MLRRMEGGWIRSRKGGGGFFRGTKILGMCEQEKGNENEPFEVFYLQIQAKMKITAAPAALKATKDRLSGFSGMT